jgi:hypothetical protein
LFFLILLIFSSCEEEFHSGTVLQGTVMNMLDSKPIHPAFLILEDELLAVTKENGYYEISSLNPSIYTLVCSAIDYGDKTMLVELPAGNVVSQDILLHPDESQGKIYGELHDKTLYDEQLMVNPSMAAWNEKELFDGVSGATIQTMTFGFDLPASEIYIADSLFALTDGFGQYWFDIQTGTYPIRISSSGYRDTIQIVKVEADSSVFANFILCKE